MYMENFKTVDVPLQADKDILQVRQAEDVAKMRTSLLACSDPNNIVPAMKNITVLRVLHQVARIIRYLDMMDRIENKLYDSLDYFIENMSEADPLAWKRLLDIQERLQQNMINSHKLLQPYLNIDEFDFSDMLVSTASEPSDSVLSKDSRELIRANAQKLIDILDPGGDMRD